MTDAASKIQLCGWIGERQEQNLFWHGVHPTAGHLLTAGFAYDVLNGIPFPMPEPSTWAMILAGFVFSRLRRLSAYKEVPAG